MNKKEIKQAVIILLVTVVMVVTSSWLSKKEKIVQINPDEFKSVVECPLDTKSYEETKLKKNVFVLQDKPSYGVKGSFAGHDYNVTIKRKGLQSQVACGYLFYSLSAGDRPIETSYENLYMALASGKQFSGHILPNAENTISEEKVNGKTEILLPLSSIYYDGTTRTNIKKADWASLLNVSDQITFNIALNTEDTQGYINSVEIAYKCWNPQTGKETDDCSLEVVK